MKKALTRKQLKELKDLGYKGSGTIGGLIEFMFERKLFTVGKSWWRGKWILKYQFGWYQKFNGLCDTLHRDVKEVLERDAR